MRSAGDTVTARSPAPDDVMDELSTTETVADCARYRFITPLPPELTVATPLAKLIDVLVPKLTAVPDEFFTVGCCPLGDAKAPEKVSDFVPEYPVAVFPAESRAVMVRFCDWPAT